MCLFKKNKKYDVKPEENVPQFVYGIPDFVRDKKAVENSIDSVDNIPNEVSNGTEAEIEETIEETSTSSTEEVQDKYDVKPEENVPQFVYGIPDFAKKKDNENKDNE